MSQSDEPVAVPLEFAEVPLPLLFFLELPAEAVGTQSDGIESDVGNKSYTDNFQEQGRAAKTDRTLSCGEFSIQDRRTLKEDPLFVIGRDETKPHYNKAHRSDKDARQDCQ